MPEALLGYAMHLLHERPVLGPAAIRRSLGQGAVDAAVLPPIFQSLVAADLADQVESIRITPRNPDPEQWSQIWSSMNVGLRAFGRLHRLGGAYRGKATPRSPLPVIERRARAFARIHRPSIARVFAQPPPEPAERDRSDVSGQYAVLRGSGLPPKRRRGCRSADGGCSGVGNTDTECLPGRYSGRCDRPASATHTGAALHGGPGGAADLRLREQSNAIAIGVRPIIAPDAANDPGIALANAAADNGRITGTVTVRLAHPVEPASARACASPAATRCRRKLCVLRRSARRRCDRLAFDIANVPQGPYLVRVEIDGAESVPADDANGFSRSDPAGGAMTRMDPIDRQAVNRRLLAATFKRLAAKIARCRAGRSRATPQPERLIGARAPLWSLRLRIRHPRFWRWATWSMKACARRSAARRHSRSRCRSSIRRHHAAAAADGILRRLRLIELEPGSEPLHRPLRCAGERHRIPVWRQPTLDPALRPYVQPSGRSGPAGRR